MRSTRRIDLSADRLRLLERRLRDKGVQRAPARTIRARRDQQAPVPLSFPQQRLWFIEQLTPGNPAYTIPTALRVYGELDIEAFTRACREVVRRHESLRTVFVAVDGIPWQRVLPESPFQVTVTDLRQSDDPDQAAQQHAQKLFTKPFDLTTGPLLRVELLRVAADESVVLVAMHHIISDLWSMRVLLSEIVAFYGQFVLGVPSGAPELPIQYPDFALWQRAASQQQWDDDLRYWVERLADAPPENDLPTARPRPERQSLRGRSIPIELSPSLVARLRALARAEGTTLFTLFITAFKVLLFRLSGQPDIVVGTPVANRARPELEPLIGFLVNTVVLRTDLSGNPTVRELVRRVGQVCLEAFNHQQLPFERLVEELQPARSLNRMPLFQVAFLYQNVPFPTWEAGSIRVEPLPVDTGSTKFDLQLQLFEDGDTVHGHLEASRDLFDEETIQRMVTYLRRLLHGIGTDPDRAVSALALMDETERARMVGSFNDPVTRLEAEASQLAADLQLATGAG